MSTPRLGLFIRGGSHAYQDQLIGGVHQECRDRGVNLYCLAGGNITLPDPRNFVYGLPTSRDLDAVIIVKGTLGAEDGDPEVKALLDRLGVRAALTIGAREPGFPCVTVDNSSGVRMLTRHLIQEHGRRRVAFVAGFGREAERRFAGYRLAHRDCGMALDERLLIEGDFQFASGQRAVATLFDGGGRGCDAIVGANDKMALGAIEALSSRGLRVPEDVAVVGFDDIEEARFATPPLTTVRQPPRQLGIAAVRAVLARAAGDASVGDVVLETLPRLRQSCGCFRGARRAEPEPALRAEPGERGPAAWASAVAASGLALETSLPADWAEQIVASLRSDLEDGQGERFLTTVDALVSRAAGSGNVSTWHEPIAALRREVERDLGREQTKLLLAESLFERAHLLVGEHAERVQGRRRLETEAIFRTLGELGGDVLTSLDRPAIGRALAEHLPTLRVSSAAVVIHASDQPPTGQDECRLIIAWDGERGLRTFDDGLAFRAGQLVPEAGKPSLRHSLMVQPLCFKNEALGWCLFEMDPPRAVVCEEIPEQVSAALKATALQERLVAEVTKRERAERARLQHEIELAAGIQMGILPKSRGLARLEISASMVPATEAGGDYFDILPFDGGGWIGIGDVAGHGLHAGLVMMMLQSIISATTRDDPRASPAKVWAVLNAVLYENVRTRLGREEHATLTLIRYEDHGRLVFAGAHEDILIHRARRRTCEQIKTQGIWAGILEDVPPGTISDQEFMLEPGDTILLHSDGVTEARNRGRQLFGLPRLRAAFERGAGLPLDDLRERIMGEVRGFMAEQLDDMTLVALRYR
ncbi:MAG TPA: SpoIIE family protein phosphatase [Polyangia bacterium]|nr:SpoIIE family protein phosphatase [Polyangia bacterium]